MTKTNYFFEDFTEEHYTHCLELAQKSYLFRSFHDFSKKEHFVIWRHDIDISPQRALRLAEIESKMGISATYFLRLHSEFYNLFEKEIYDLFKQIILLGHNIGLHFETKFYLIEEESKLIEHLNYEKNLLENLFRQEINAFSFHNPEKFELSFNKASYANMINTYSDYFTKTVGYCSDSNGYWRFRRLQDVLISREDKQLQVLTHPSLWQPYPCSPRERIQRCLDGRMKNAASLYDRTLQLSNRENVGLDRIKF